MHRSANYMACLAQVRAALGFFPEEDLDDAIRQSMPAKVHECVPPMPLTLSVLGGDRYRDDPLTRRMVAVAFIRSLRTGGGDPEDLELLGKVLDDPDRVLLLAELAVTDGAVDQVSFNPDAVAGLVDRVMQLLP